MKKEQNPLRRNGQLPSSADESNAGANTAEKQAQQQNRKSEKSKRNQ